jgi:hypothetical protein
MKSDGENDILYVAQPSTRTKSRSYILHGALAFLVIILLLFAWPSLTVANKLVFAGLALLLALTVLPYVAPQVVFSQKGIRRRGALGRISTFDYRDIERIKNSGLVGLIIAFRNGRGFQIPPWWQADNKRILDLVRTINPDCQIDGDGTYEDPNKPITLDL